MALRRYSRAVDGSIPIKALLYTDEHLLTSQESVGIYDGLLKSPRHQSGTIHVTSHRLFYIDNKDFESASFAVDLSHVTQTEYYAGLFTSSPKVTLHLAGRILNGPASDVADNAGGSGSGGGGGGVAGGSRSNDSGGLVQGAWECGVCAYRNPPGLSPSATQVCELCGVPRSDTAPTPTTPSKFLSQSQPSSLPSTSLSSGSRDLHNPKHIPISTHSSPGSNAKRSRKPSTAACPACTFLNHPSLRECEICGTELHVVDQDRGRQMKSAPTTRTASPDLGDEEGDVDDDDDEEEGRRSMKVSFRKGGDKALYTILKRSLKTKAWESQATRLYKLGNGANSDRSGEGGITRSGITGILRTVETSAQGRESDLKDALQDLEALMVKAKDMVRLAAELNDKLTSTTTTTNSSVAGTSPSPSPSPASPHELPEEATFIRSSLSQLGLQMTDLPVTNDMIKDEDKWIGELARELAGVLKGMMRDRGIVALDEVWGGWNRARGVALLPPSTFLQVIPHLPMYTSPPISKRTFNSGLSVLHTPPYSQHAFSDRLTGYLVEEGPKSTIEVALVEGITVALAKEMIDAVEVQGDVIRDDAECVIVDGGVGVGGETGVRWWPNLFVGYTWDGQVDEQ